MRTTNNTTNTEVRRSFINEFSYGNKEKAISALIQSAHKKTRNEDNETGELIYEVVSGFSRLAKTLDADNQIPVSDI